MFHSALNWDVCTLYFGIHSNMLQRPGTQLYPSGHCWYYSTISPLPGGGVPLYPLVTLVTVLLKFFKALKYKWAMFGDNVLLSNVYVVLFLHALQPLPALPREMCCNNQVLWVFSYAICVCYVFSFALAIGQILPHALQELPEIRPTYVS